MSSWTVASGIAAALLLTAAMLYAVRRRAPAHGPGRLSMWLQLHLYGGVLFLLLVLLHSGFAVPRGLLALSLWLLSIWVVVSGIAGVIIQRWIPRTLTSGLSTEVHFDRIEELAETIRERAAILVESSGEAIQEFFEQELKPRMAGPRPRLIYFLNVSGGIQSEVQRFGYLRRFLSEADEVRLDELKALFVTKLELDAHYTLQRALRWWLHGHVPFSLLLVVLLGFHIFFVTYY